MKRTFCLVTLVGVLTIIATAQNPRSPSIVTSRSGDASFHGSPGWGNPPANAAKLIFYGGDVNPSDPNVDGFVNGNTLLVPDTATYGAVTVPANSKVVATGIFFNQVPACSDAPCTVTPFDPATATYDIRTGVAEGMGGASVASGSGPQAATKTGRILPYFGASMPEYSTSIAFTEPFLPTPGTTYWVNESSQCTDSGNKNCSTAEIFADNTTQQTNGINPGLQPVGMMFLNSAILGYSWINLCEPSVGLNAQQCAYLSFGIYGH
jgi:hypothetical protein